MSTTATASLPSQQKAVIFNTSSHALRFTSSAPLPSAPAEHVIKVHATAITNGELTWAPFVNWPTEHVPCYDVAGTIITPVEGSPFKVGQDVYGRVDAKREGTAREYATILPSETAHLPDGLRKEDAAAIPMSALTAWQALFEQGLLTGESAATSVPHVNEEGIIIGGQAEGKRVLVLGAAGGVGSMAIQFAKLAGAFVVGTASVKNKAFTESLGADEVIDYTTINMAAWIGGGAEKKFDLVFDCVGGQSMLDGWNAVKDNGMYVSVVPGFKEPLGGKPIGVTTRWFVMDSRGGELGEISKFIKEGVVRGSVDSVWRLEECQEAFKRATSGHARGKVILQVIEDTK